jgi:hypothetical protein
MTQLTGFRSDRQGAYIEKDPDATLDYSMDWSDWLSAGDNIATATWSVSTITGDADPVTVDSSSTNTLTGIATAIVSGGTVNNTYTLKCHVTTDNGLIDERTFRLLVKNRSL